MRDIESMLRNHAAATALRAAGQPIWRHKIDLRHVFREERLTFEQRRDAIVRRLRTSAWAVGNPEVLELADELADTADGDQFDQVWDAVYDQADEDRVWIATF